MCIVNYLHILQAGSELCASVVNYLHILQAGSELCASVVNYLHILQANCAFMGKYLDFPITTYTAVVTLDMLHSHSIYCN